MPVTIINRLANRDPIPQHIEQVLRAMFKDYDRVLVKQTFNRGLSGSAVYLVEPYEDNRPQLPNVVKIDHYDQMHAEHKAIDELIARYLPRAVVTNEKPINPKGSDYAGLRYPFAGDGIFDFSGLYDFCATSPLSRCQPVFTRLFRVLDVLYRDHAINYDLTLRTHYDDALPNNLVIDCAIDASGGVIELYPRDADNVTVNVDNHVRLDSNWVVTEYEWDKNGLTLNTGLDHTKYRLQVINLPSDRAMQYFQIGDPIGRSLTGKVIKTRQSVLTAAVKAIVGHSVELDFPFLQNLPGQIPNPLYYLDRRVMAEGLAGYIGPIHGDLNLENVMVEEGGVNIQIIDFAKSRKSHIIRDFLHLEMNITTTLLTEALMDNGWHNPERIIEFYERLHCALEGNSTKAGLPEGLQKPFAILQWIREAAKQQMRERDSWREYYNPLIIYLLGCLRYPIVAKRPSTDGLGKQTAFYGAAATLNILQNSVDCQKFQNLADTSSTQASSTSTQTTNQSASTSSPPPTPPHPVTAMPLSKMREVLIATFKEEELRNFIFDRGLDAETFGRGKSEMARELIDYYRRRNILPQLQQALFDARPNSDWWGKG